MSGENYVNTASVAEVASLVGPSDVTADLSNFTGFPSAPFWGEFEKGTASAEIVRVTNVAGNTITITRGEGGTAATTHSAGVSFEHVVPASHFTDMEAHRSATNAHGVTGNVVGTSGSQTLQDKLYRGAVKSQHSDTLPAGITASVETVADTTASRDGHVHRNTGGHADRRGFLLEQSGTPRWQVFNDGTVDVAPGASSRPGFRNHGTTTLDGDVTVNDTLIVSAGGVQVTAGGLVVAGGAIISGGIDLGATTVDSLSSDSTIHAAGALDTDSNLTVDGTSTLTGAVTTGAGLTVGNGATVAQGITSWGGRVAISVSTTASVTTPTTGDVVYDRSDGLWKRWTGSAWLTLRPNPVKDVEDALTETTSSTFTETPASGTPCSLTFVAPQSGAIEVHNSAFVDNLDAGGRSYCSWIIRNGGTIGSGTTFLDAGDTKALANLSTADVSATRVTLVTGLTAGNTYNIRQQFKATVGTTAQFQWKELAIVSC